MKRNRRIESIAVLLIICACIIGLPVYAVASEPYVYIQTSDHAVDICQQMGILRGGDNGLDRRYLSSYTTRIQAVHITLRLLAKEEEAMRYTGTSSFNDAHLVTYQEGRNLLAYVRKNSQYGWQGDTGGNINPNGLVTAQALYKVMLTSLGYEINVDFTWESTVKFAEKLGMVSASKKLGNLTNRELAEVLVETMKAKPKGMDITFSEDLLERGVIRYASAYAVGMLPGSPGYQPLLPYQQGGPLVREVRVDAVSRKVTIHFNTNLNPTFAKTVRNYQYYLAGIGYVPLPTRCTTAMPDEYSVIIQFPVDGWAAYQESTERDPFLVYIATDRINELRISGLVDVDGKPIRETYVDIPKV